jgi:hypothetical protein
MRRQRAAGILPADLNDSSLPTWNAEQLERGTRNIGTRKSERQLWGFFHDLTRFGAKGFGTRKADWKSAFFRLGAMIYLRTYPTRNSKLGAGKSGQFGAGEG